MPYLTAEETEAYRRTETELDRLTDTTNDPLWKPLPGPQTAAYECPADIVGFGGQAGGGKSDLILGLSGTAHQRSIIFRREAKQGRSMIDRSRELFAGKGRFNENLGVWRSLPGGRQIEFAGVKDPSDVFNWRGQPHDFIGIDEADAFLEGQIRFLMGWLRTTTVGQRCRAVFTFNPPATAAGRWLLTFFGPWIDRKHPKPALPGELRWYATVRGGKEVECPSGEKFDYQGERIQPTSRTFFPASVRDNPYLMATDYVARLQALPEPLRSQLLYGDMAAGVEDDPWQVIPTEWVEAAMTRWTPDGDDPDVPLSAVGVDPARGGKDRTAIARRKRTWFAPVEVHAGANTPDGDIVADLVAKAVRTGLYHDLQAAVNIDGIGVGGAVVDACRRLGLRVVPVIFSQTTKARNRAGTMGFVNRRAHAYWSLRDSLDPVNGDELMLPPDPELLADLTAPKWEPRPAGALVESKENIQSRIGRSPDKGDAVVYAHYEGNTLGASEFVTAAVSDMPIFGRRQVEEEERPFRLFGR